MVSSEETSLKRAGIQEVALSISLERVRLFLQYLVAGLSLLGLWAEVGFELFNRNDPWDLVKFASLSWEANLPTWAASTLLLAAAFTIWLIGKKAQHEADHWYRHWYAMAMVFLYISLDETAQIHENLGHLLSTGDGLFYYDWVIPASAILAVLGLVYWPFLVSLSVPTRRRFILAATLYIGGALLMELPLGLWVSEYGPSNLGYGLIDWVEETLELVGVAVFLHALICELLNDSRVAISLE